MAFEEITNKLTSAGFFPIQVEASINIDDSNGRVFIGDLDGFIKAAKALKAEVIFVSKGVLEAEDFKYDVSENEESGDNDANNESIYLPSVMPLLSEFEKYIGNDCAYKLSAPMIDNTLDFYIQESWWSEFVEMFTEAVEKVEESRETAREGQKMEREAKEKELLSQLGKLINDGNFVRLPTQKAMRAYALDKIPELKKIDGVVLQDKIQTINANIAAKGLNRKR